MEAIADLADEHSFGELVVTHEQNLVLPHVEQSKLRAVYDRLREIGCATANLGLLTNMIVCPGLSARPASKPPIMTTLAPAAIALVMSPE